MLQLISIIGLVGTVAYVFLIVTLFPIELLKNLETDKLGSFIGGIVSPLALFWLVLGYLQQARDIRMNTEALKLQKEELEHLVVANEQQVNAAHDAIKSSSDHADRQIRLQTAVLSGQLLLPIFIQTREKCSSALREVSAHWRDIVGQVTGDDADVFLAKIKNLAETKDGILVASQELQNISDALQDKFFQARQKTKNNNWNCTDDFDKYQSLDSARRTISIIAQQIHQIRSANIVTDCSLLRAAAFPDFVATYKYCVFPLDSAIHQERNSLPYEPGQSLIKLYTEQELLKAIQ